MTIVDRETSCFLVIQAVFERSKQVGQVMLNRSPAEQYYSDQFPLYQGLSYRKGYHLALADKSETYFVEADNAELRHYLTRLTRCSRCFSRCIDWLNRYLKVFAHAWNKRQLHNHAQAYNKKHIIDFVCL